MRLSLTVSAVVGLGAISAGCGPAQSEFAAEYNTAWCEHVLACGDPALLTFDGITSVEVCEEREVESLIAWASGCQYVPGAATQCVFEVQELTCPAGGGLAERPLSCEQVYVNCSDTTD